MSRKQTVTAVLAAVAAVLATAAIVLAGPAQAAGGLSATFSKDSDWGTGYQARFTIANAGTTAVSAWTVAFDLPAGVSMGTFWDATITTSGAHVTAVNRSYNGTVAPGASVTFGFIANGGSGAPTGCTLNGGTCSAGGTPPPTHNAANHNAARPPRPRRPLRPTPRPRRPPPRPSPIRRRPAARSRPRRTSTWARGRPRSSPTSRPPAH